MRPTRLGFLVPPGNPTTEPEVFRLAPSGVTVHFHRMYVAGGVPGAHEGQEERNRQQIEHMEEALFLSGVGMPTVEALARFERDLGKPAISSCSAMVWNALRVAGLKEKVRGFGRLFD